MAQHHQISMASLQGLVINRKDGMLRCLFNSFCTAVESPELPDWFKFPQIEQSGEVELEDDFVLPTKLGILEEKTKSQKAYDRRSNYKTVSCEIGEVDADEISNILKSNFMSPDAVTIAMSCCSVKVSGNLVDKILRRFCNDWVPAFGFFKWADKQIGYDHSPNTYDMMVDILGKTKQFDAMWGLVEEMICIGGLVSLSTMAKVMRRLAGAGRWGEAIKTFHSLDAFGVKKDTSSMNVLLNTLCKERSVKHARDVFLELRRDIPPNASSFNALIHGWCTARKVEEARRTMDEMREFGFNPCVISYTSLIESYCMDKNFRKVDAILDEMHSNGCPPNVVTYTIVMHSLGKAKETQEALKVFDKMKRDGCEPDVSFYNSLIYILSEAGRLRDANDVYEEMCKNGISPNVTTYNTLISAACDHSEEENALKLLQIMEESACKPDIKTYTPLLKLCCKRKWMKILLYLLGHMFKKDIGIDLGTYTLLVNGLCRNGKLEQSCLFLEEMVSKGLMPKQNTYTMLVEALDRKNMGIAKAKVQQFMMQAEKMKQAGSHLRNKHQIEERPVELSV